MLGPEQCPSHELRKHGAESKEDEKGGFVNPTKCGCRENMRGTSDNVTQWCRCVMQFSVSIWLILL